MTKIYSTLGRKFNKKDLEEAQKMGMELVSTGNVIDEYWVPGVTELARSLAISR